MPYAIGRTRLISQGAGGLSRKMWSLDNPDNDPSATVDTAGYITDARAIGMGVGDLVLMSSANATIFGLHMVASIAGNGSANLTDSAAISTNTD